MQFGRTCNLGRLDWVALLALSVVTPTKHTSLPNPFIHSQSNAVAKLQIEPNQNHLLKNLEGSIFAWSVGCLFGRHADNSSDVTLAFEDAA